MGTKRRFYAFANRKNYPCRRFIPRVSKKSPKNRGKNLITKNKIRLK